jgi:hypothetical protein
MIFLKVKRLVCNGILLKSCEVNTTFFLVSEEVLSRLQGKGKQKVQSTPQNFERIRLEQGCSSYLVRFPKNILTILSIPVKPHLSYRSSVFLDKRGCRTLR